MLKIKLWFLSPTPVYLCMYFQVHSFNPLGVILQTKYSKPNFTKGIDSNNAEKRAMVLVPCICPHCTVSLVMGDHSFLVAQLSCINSVLINVLGRILFSSVVKVLVFYAK